MTELRDDLDRALRSVAIGEAPVRRAMRDGRRLRTRRRLLVLAGALAIAAVAAVAPSLARTSAAPSVPVTHPTGTPVPSATPTAHRDPVVTDEPPGVGAATGTVAQGLTGGLRWAAVLGPAELNPQGQHDVCYTAYLAATATGSASGQSAQLTQACAPSADGLVVIPGTDPAGFTGSVASGDAGAGPPQQFMLGVVAPDVAYFVLTFTDGQQLKLIPVGWQGRRYIAWMAPAQLTVAGLTAHLGGPNVDDGQLTTAVPFQQAGAAPLFGLWLTPGQAAPPRASAVIGHGTGNEPSWSASAYEGPWGTCFVTGPGAASCQWVTRLSDTALLGLGGNPPAAAFGSAAPGVARLRVSLSNGRSVQVTPVSVGNERLFALWPGAGVTATEWTAYDAAGRAIAAGASVASSAARLMPQG
jgi:hypothetical protein